MSTRAVLIWLGAALLLGVAALVVLRSGGQAGAASKDTVARGERVVDFDASQVKSFSVTTPEGKQDTVARAPSGDSWALTTGGSTTSWPLVATQARNAARLLAELRSEGEPDPKSELGSSPTSVRIELDGGGFRTLRFSERTLGGTVLVVSETPAADGTGAPVARRAMVPSNRLNILRDPGPRGWRDTAAVPEIGPEVSRITLKNDQRTVSLARQDNRWHLEQPVSAPASPDRVTAVIGAISRVTITDFLDDRKPDSALTGLNTPTLRITAETDRRPAGTGPASAGAARVELALGGPADSSGRRVFASITPSSGPTRIVAVDVTQLSQSLPSDPVAYIAPQATQVSPPDIGVVRLTAAEPPPPGAPATDPAPSDRRFQRSLSNWAEILNGQESLLPPSDSAAVNDLLLALANKPSQSVTITSPAGFAPLGYVTLAKLDGAPLDVLGVGTIGSASVVFRGGEVYRAYPPDAMPTFFRAWLAQSGGLKTPPKTPDAASAGDPAEVVK